MNHIEFIEKHVREELLKLGFSLGVAQGGAFQAIDMYKRMSQASRKGKILMMFYGTQNCGRRSSSYPLTALRSEKLNGTPSRACSEKAKAAVHEHKRLSGATNVSKLRG